MRTEKHILVKKMFQDELNKSLPERIRVAKAVYGVEAYWLSDKE